MHFEKQVLATDLAGGYQVIACDVNGDGKLDLIALASDIPDLVWFENPTWKRHVLAHNLPTMVNAACWNQSPRKPPIIALTYEFSMNPRESAGIVSILEPNGDVREPWKIREIDRLATSHRLRWVDVDGSGNKVLINAPLVGAEAKAPDYRGHVPLVYYKPGEWNRRSIGNAEQGVVHGIFVTDWDHDGREAVLIGGFLGIHLYRFGRGGEWSRTEISTGSPLPWPKCGTSDVSVGWLGKKRYLAAIEPWHGNEVVVYQEQGGKWQRNVIDDTILDGHNVETVDLDGDGRDEIVVGFRGEPYGVFLYRSADGHWQKQVVEQGEVSAAGCVVADLEANGLLHIACIGTATHNLVLYRQRSK
jgi:aldos-2-ulose dehydratase/isomerase family protein